MNLTFLGNKIRLRREMRGLTQADLAQALQVSSQAVSKWERGQNAPDITLVPELTKLLGVTADWLLGSNENGRDRQDTLAEERAPRRRRSGTFRRADAPAVVEPLKIAR